jgi:hypothetical protein
MTLKIVAVGGRGREFRGAERDGIERQRERRQAAAIDRQGDVAFIHPHPARERRGDALLHRVVRAVIAVGHPLLLHTVREHAGVLAGTVVVNAAWLLAGTQHGVRGRLVQREVRTAGEHRVGHRRLRQDRAGGRHMERLPAMRRGAQRQLLAGELETRDAAGLDERQGLEHLDRRPHEAVVRRVAGAGDQSLFGVRDRDVDAVNGLDHLAADRLDVAAAWGHPSTLDAGSERSRVARSGQVPSDAKPRITSRS